MNYRLPSRPSQDPIIHPLTGKREKFCQLVAAGATYQKPAGYDRKLGAEAGSRLMGEITVQLRVQELRRPVLRKLRRKIEYGLQKALEQCQVAYDLAYEKGDARGILKAVEMQAKLAKLLTERIDVNHQSLLDNTSTEVLLEMKREIEVRRAKQKKLAEIRVVNSETDPETPRAPSLESQIGSHLVTVASSQGPDNSKIAD